MPSFPDQLLSRLSEHLSAQMGWHFPRERWRELETGIETAARGLGIADATAYAHDLLAAKLSKRQIEGLAATLTVGETYFFRDPRSFEILREKVFPDLIRARRHDDCRLRIWSAGCCTGEEAYSIAILLDQLLPDISDWKITLLATDINSRFLQRAVEGTFTEWSFRGAPSWLKERYFNAAPGRRFALVPRIKSLVTFAYLNLGEDVFPSLTNNTNAMDLILCRNVLMYFSAERAAQVIRNFHRSLVSNGLFLFSAVESSPQLAELFVPISFDGGVMHRKRRDFDTIPADAATPTVPAFPIEAEFSLLPQPPERIEQAPAVVDPRTVDPRSVYEAALALFDRGRYTEAAAALEANPAANDSDVDRATLLARIHANLGDLATARSWAERAIAADRTNALSHYLRAVILQEQGQVPEALATLQKAVYLQPDFVLVHFALGNLEHHQGRCSVAARHFNNAFNLLQKVGDDELLPHAEGMAAGRLKEMIRSILETDAA